MGSAWLQPLSVLLTGTFASLIFFRGEDEKLSFPD